MNKHKFSLVRLLPRCRYSEKWIDEYPHSVRNERERKFVIATPSLTITHSVAYLYTI